MLNISHSLEKILAFEFSNADISEKQNKTQTQLIFPFDLNLKERVDYKASP